MDNGKHAPFAVSQTMLIVDDDFINRSILEHIFSPYYPIEEAEDGKNYVDGKPDYADEFIDRQTFAWDSKIGQGIASKYVKSIEASENIRLFIKKSDGEGVDFYYMGKAKISEMNESTKINNRGKTEPITKMKLKLKTEVREDLYDYLHN